MKNNNTKIIRKITSRTLRANTRRNIFIAIAIALTAFMITSVFSIGLSFYESIRLSGFRFEGIYSHASIMGLTHEQLETLEGLSYVRRVSHSGLVGSAKLPGHEHGVTMFYTCPGTWRHFQTPVFTNIEGRNALAQNEIVLSRAKLSRMGIHQPYVGMEIPLEFTDSLPTHSKTFILSGFYTEFVSTLGGGTPIFVSQAFAESHGLVIAEDTNVNVQFTSFTRANELTRRLANDLGLSEGQYYAAHPAFTRGMDSNPLFTYMIMSVFVAFFMFTGFLLVYNVMYASVSKDVRLYGMLKTLGTTPRQLRRIVNGQVLRLLYLGIPAGLAAAALVSFVLVPAFMGNIATGVVISFSPLIYIGGAMFTLLTTYLGAFTSARKAAQVSPIESTKYAGELAANIKVARSSANGRPHRMAWRNAFRERKRAIIVLISLFLGVTVFTTTVTIVGSADVDNEINYWYDFDFVISGDLDTQICDDFAAQVASINGVTAIHRSTFSMGHIESKMLHGSVYGVDTAWLLEIDPNIANYVDIAAFERGETALRSDRWIRFHETNPGSAFADMHASSEDLPIGTVVELSLSTDQGTSWFTTYVEIGGPIRRVTPVGVGLFYFSFGAPGRRVELLMSNNFLNQHHAPVYRLGVEVRRGADSYVNSALNSILPHGMSVTSTYEARRASEEGMFTLFVMGIGLSAILGIIGIFNFINVIAVGLYVRKRELATLESIGMTKRQMRAMLRWEGAIYWIAIIFASLIAGPGIAYGLYYVVSNQAPTQFPQFVYPLLPIGLVYGVIIILCTITPEIAYRGISKLSMVERLREVE
ncbi:MAG: ABC transporter permease [Defluviitaleaceae bacterium]|nr:ABC transporter permease [Defluviitaleaceae bacterium]